MTLNGETLGLVLGSSVLAAGIGAYLQAGRQREEQFRERMIQAALEFLEQTAAAQEVLLGVENQQAYPPAEDGAARNEILDAVNAPWTTVPRLEIVFPDHKVADAARDLITAIDDLNKMLIEADGRLSQEEIASLKADVGDKADIYTAVTRKSIRRPAFRRMRIF